MEMRMQVLETRVVPIVLILALGLAIRVAWILVIPVNPVSDSHAYHLFAATISDHGVYGWSAEEPTAYWAVGPAAIYGAGYHLFGTGSGLSVVLINLISSVTAIWFLYDLGKRWFSERTGQLAALLFALWPVTIQFTTVLASELHFIALTLAGLAALDRAGFRSGELIFLGVAGVCFAGATYVRPIALLIPFVVLLGTSLRTLRVSIHDAAKAILVTGIILALVAPWSARNERIFDTTVFISTNFWANFWMGNHPGTTGGYAPLPAATNGMGEIERSEYLKEASLKALKNEPKEFVTRTAWKALILHERETIGVSWNEAEIKSLSGSKGLIIMKLVSTGFWYMMLVLALMGIVLLALKGKGWTVILVPPVWLWLYFTGVHAVIVVGDRYHMPAIPMIALLAAVTLNFGINKFATRDA